MWNKKHINYYLSIILILGLGFFLVINTSYNKELQMAMVIITALFYVGWGILHHFINHDITAKIVLEYILMGSLGVTVVLFLLKGSA